MRTTVRTLVLVVAAAAIIVGGAWAWFYWEYTGGPRVIPPANPVEPFQGPPPGVPPEPEMTPGAFHGPAGAPSTYL
jgi:hypothetical protein